MRMLSLLLIGLGVGVLLAEGGLARATQPADLTAPEIAQPKSWNAQAQARAAPASKNGRRPYEGRWASSEKMCRDQDGTERVFVQGDRFYWYETQCRAHDIKAINERSWTMRMSCEGEGEKFQARPRLSLDAGGRLILENAPVTPVKRQVYVRCDGGKGGE